MVVVYQFTECKPKPKPKPTNRNILYPYTQAQNAKMPLSMGNTYSFCSLKCNATQKYIHFSFFISREFMMRLVSFPRTE